MTPPVAVTHRDRIPVTPTRPTFWENDVYGKVLKIPPRMRADAVGAKAAGDRRLIDLSPGHFAERQKHSGRFDHDHDHHDAHGDDRDQVEFRDTEPEWDHHIHPCRRHHLLEMHHAEQRRQYCAGDDAEQHGDIGDEAGEPANNARMITSTNSAMPRPASFP